MERTSMDVMRAKAASLLLTKDRERIQRHIVNGHLNSELVDLLSTIEDESFRRDVYAMLVEQAQYILSELVREQFVSDATDSLLRGYLQFDMSLPKQGGGAVKPISQAA